MSIQSEFPFIQAPVSLKPANTRANPTVWVEKLGIYKALPVSADNELRMITLHRGLNILWAEPGARRGPGEPRAKISGHATGKTTFCRMLRYILGDATFGNDSFRNGFRDKFPQGWVVGEVWVESRRWLVGRPLGIGPQHFAILGGTIADLNGKTTAPQGGWQDYLKAIDATIFGGMKERGLPATGLPLGWDMLLQWLARDQESRYSGLLAWRSPTSQSQGVELQEAEKENVIRMSLALASDVEQRMMREFADAAKEHKSAVGKRGVIDYQLRTDIERLAGALEIEMSLDSPLPEELVKQRISSMESEAAALRRGMVDDSRLQGLRAKWGEAVEATQSARVRWNDAKEAAEEVAEDIEIAEGRKTEEERAHKKRDWKPARGYCSQMLTEEVRTQCEFARLRKSDDALDSELNAIRTEADVPRYEKAQLDREVMRLFVELQARERGEAALQAEVEAAEVRFRPDQDRAEALDGLAATAKILEKNLVEAQTNKEQNESTISSLAEKKNDLDKKLDTEKARHQTRMAEYSDLYRFVVKELLGEEIDAGVDWAGKTIEPFLNYHGKLDSAALETVRLLAFDVTALAESYIRDATFHPRFLLHDSPREADLSADIYYSLFWLMERLEREADGDPPFQYIITTTEPPPEDLRKEPWLLNPVLRTLEASQRFLGVDL